jgi:hypothetical protein
LVIADNGGRIDDYFGSSVAINGDTLFIGSYLDDTAGTDLGAVYIYTRTGTTWTQQQILTAPTVQETHFSDTASPSAAIR